MKTQPKSNLDVNRVDLLRSILTRHRVVLLERVRTLRKIEEGDALPPPGDELDVARSLGEVETDVSLIERADQQLKWIDDALSRLDRGTYGLCQDCGEEIPLERLRAVPFTVRCVDCQNKRNRLLHVGEGTISEPFNRQWALPEEMAGSLEDQDLSANPEEAALIVRRESPFGPEEGEFEQLPPTPTARRRGRVRKAPRKNEE